MPISSSVRESIAIYGVSEVTPDETLLEILGLPKIPISELLEGPQGLTKAARIRCESFAELVRRASTKRPSRPRIGRPKEAFEYLKSKNLGWTIEHFGILALDSKGGLLTDKIISKGTATGTLISPRECFKEALRTGAVSIIVYHNHPSGDATPSQEDIALTRRLRAAGEQIGVTLADHIILGDQTYHSFRAAEGWDNGGLT